MLPPIVIRLAISGGIALLISRYTIKDQSVRRMASSVTLNGVWAYVLGVKLSFLLTHLSSVQSEPLMLLYGWGSSMNTLIGVIAVLGYFSWFILKKSQHPKPHIMYMASATGLFTLLFFLSAFIMKRQAPPSANITTQAYSDITLLDGSPYDFKPDQITVLNFWATWCPPCRAEMPELNAFAKEHTEINFITVNNITSESGGSEAVQKFLQDKGYQFATTLDYQNKLTSEFEIKSFPTTIVLSAEGTLIDRHIGVMSKEQLESYLE